MYLYHFNICFSFFSLSSTEKRIFDDENDGEKIDKEMVALTSFLSSRFALKSEFFRTNDIFFRKKIKNL